MGIAPNVRDGLLVFVTMTMVVLFTLLGAAIGFIILLSGAPPEAALGSMLAGLIFGIALACWISNLAR